MVSEKDDLITEEIEEYEKKTGKKAVWRGIITESFKKWKQGLKVYKRINDTISIDEEFKEKIYDFCEKFNFIRAKTYRYGADIIIEACNKLKSLGKNYNLDTIKEFIDNAIEKAMDATILKDTEILKFYRTQMNSSINFTDEALQIFQDFYENNKSYIPKEQLDQYNNKYELIMSYISDSLEIQKEHVDDLELYLNLPSPIIIKSQKYKVLIVDNDKAVHKLVGSYFQERGISTESALNSFEALLLLRRNKPDVIFLDVALPDINGIELCKRLRSNRNYIDVKIYFLTAHSESFQELKELLEKKTADGLIKKPFGKKDFEFIFNFFKKS